jgi:tripartite-type tricarboxylate transporter receptor subunit TctC
MILRAGLPVRVFLGREKGVAISESFKEHASKGTKSHADALLQYSVNIHCVSDRHIHRGRRMNTKMHRRNFLWTSIFSGLLAPPPAIAQQQQSGFYRGKMIYVIVGYAPGGGYDIYGRLLARHLGAHIPGSPNVVVQNMPGAASLTAANYVANIAPKDGTVIAITDQNLALFQLLGGSGVRFDVNTFGWIGSLASSNGVAVAWTASGLDSLERVKSRPVTIGTTGNNDDAYIYAKSMNALLGTDIQIIAGYSGTSGVNVAIENGEVEMMGRSTFYGLRSQKEDWIRNKKISFILQFGLAKQPELEAVPLLLDLVASEKDRQFATLVSTPPSIGYATWLPSDVPSERREVLEAAFSKMLGDQEFLDDAKRTNCEIRPKDANEIRSIIQSASSVPADAKDRAAKSLGWR